MVTQSSPASGDAGDDRGSSVEPKGVREECVDQGVNQYQIFRCQLTVL